MVNQILIDKLEEHYKETIERLDRYIHQEEKYDTTLDRKECLLSAINMMLFSLDNENEYGFYEGWDMLKDEILNGKISINKLTYEENNDK